MTPLQNYLKRLAQEYKTGIPPSQNRCEWQVLGNNHNTCATHTTGEACLDRKMRDVFYGTY